MRYLRSDDIYVSEYKCRIPEDPPSFELPAHTYRRLPLWTWLTYSKRTVINLISLINLGWLQSFDSEIFLLVFSSTLLVFMFLISFLFIFQLFMASVSELWSCLGGQHFHGFTQTDTRFILFRFGKTDKQEWKI